MDTEAPCGPFLGARMQRVFHRVFLNHTIKKDNGEYQVRDWILTAMWDPRPMWSTLPGLKNQVGYYAKYDERSCSWRMVQPDAC
eukprot:6187896-Alexandrium_andersonii.AAC.1